ncbi:MAG: hypothetical protein KBF37_09610 [Saprospiraceae bacterium]|jgi:hypothetical protein|nr:hypothetical protein [Saprospiraceae bacterium]MBP9210563.1 hypothetical protein [Saprospiraceae bacterium]
MSPKQVQSFSDFKDLLANDPALQEQFKKDPLAAANQVPQRSPLATDRWIYRIVVMSLGLVVVIISVGVIFLMASPPPSNQDSTLPTLLTALGSGAIGALAGLLAPSPQSNA